MRGKIKVILLICSAVLMIGCAGADIEPQVIAFPDENLETIIINTLNKSSDEEILSTDLAKLKELHIQNSNVSDLTGLEYCINITQLEIRETPVTDISPLSSLTKLNHLSLNNNQISDISPLSNLFELEWLSVEVSPLEDISPLSNLTNLEILGLAGDQISDISPLNSLTNLTILCLQCNEVTDISPLSNLNNLIDLRLIQNNIDDISPLVENTGLGEGDSVLLGGNNLELYEGSEDMENIKTLEARGVIVSLDPEQMAPEKLSPGAPRPIAD
jgi:internalin A